MKYLSVCSGIEAASVAWQPLGWEAVGFSEIEKFPSQVLAHHYPDVTNFGDMTKYKEWNLDTVNLLVGGTPCQSFSVAGLRKGLEDPRGNLMLTYCGLLDWFRPQWFVWENVPGVLSSNGGRDFGSFLGALAELGYGFAYRVLDAQYFGVAQRRRRVFVVGHLGDWLPSAAVLFERESLRRDTAPRREAWQKVAPTVVQGPPYSRTGNERVECDAIVAQFRQWPAEVSSTLDAHFGDKQRLEDQHVNAGCPLFVPAEKPISWSEELTASVDLAGTLQRGGDGGRHDGVMTSAMQVRRLTATECERLQGFPDNYTDIRPNNKNTPDGPRYKALGNSMAVPVMAWIGKRIAEYQACH